MRIDLYRKSVICGFIYGAISIVIMTIFIAVVLYLTDGEDFFYKEGVTQQIGNISLRDVDTVGYILAALVPVLLLRYSSVRYLPFHICSSVLSYFLTYFVIDSILYYFFSCNLLGGLDVLHYGGWVFPVGAMLGLIISVIINTFMNLKRNR